MECLYRVYTKLFRCSRRVRKLFVKDVPKEMNAQTGKWIAVYAEMENGTIFEVTPQIRSIYPPNTIIMPFILRMDLRMDDVRSWYYFTETLEYNKIPDEGIVNGL